VSPPKATQIFGPSDARRRGELKASILAVCGRAVGVAHCPNAARRLPRLNAESCVLVTKADIWSRRTKSLGLYVVGVVPLVSPEKNASAIWQKNGLAITSVKGTVVIVIVKPQTPVSAGSRLDVNSRTTTVKDRIMAERSFSFIGGSPL
jgi:hypothetical protein